MKKTIIKSSKDVKEERKKKEQEETCPECKCTITGLKNESEVEKKILGVPIYKQVPTYTCYACGCRWRIE